MFQEETVVREIVDERQMGSIMMKPNSKSSAEQHALAVQNIAEELFPFPTPAYPHVRTFVNEPESIQKIFTNYGNELDPDIVVLQWPEKLPVMVAEVVTEDMLNEELATRVWAVEARLEGVQFYLYVPSGSASQAKKLLKKAKIKNVKLRTWRNNAGLRTIDVAALR
jgi:hypothetical protein